MHQNPWRLGLRPRLCWGSLQSSPDPLIVMGWDRDLMTLSLGSANNPWTEMLDKCLVPRRGPRGIWRPQWAPIWATPRNSAWAMVQSSWLIDPCLLWKTIDCFLWINHLGQLIHAYDERLLIHAYFPWTNGLLISWMNRLHWSTSLVFEIPPHIPEYRSSRLQTKHFYVIHHTFSPSLPIPPPTSATSTFLHFYTPIVHTPTTPHMSQTTSNCHASRHHNSHTLNT